MLRARVTDRVRVRVRVRIRVRVRVIGLLALALALTLTIALALTLTSVDVCEISEIVPGVATEVARRSGELPLPTPNHTLHP